MPITDHIIAAGDYQQQGILVSELNPQPTDLSAEELQARFDALGLLIIERFNNLAGDLNNAFTAAGMRNSVHDFYNLMQKYKLRLSEKDWKGIANSYKRNADAFDDMVGKLQYGFDTYGENYVKTGDQTGNISRQYDYNKKRTAAGYDTVNIADTTWNPSQYDDDTNEAMGQWYKQNSGLPGADQQEQFQAQLRKYRLDKAAKTRQDTYALAGLSSPDSAELKFNQDWKNLGYGYDAADAGDVRRRQLGMPPRSFLELYQGDEDDNIRLRTGQLPKSIDPRRRSGQGTQFPTSPGAKLQGKLDADTEARSGAEHQNYSQKMPASPDVVGSLVQDVHNSLQQNTQQVAQVTTAGQMFSQMAQLFPAEFNKQINDLAAGGVTLEVAHTPDKPLVTVDDVKAGLDELSEHDKLNGFGRMKRGYLMGQLNYLRGHEAALAAEGKPNRLQDAEQLMSHEEMGRESDFWATFPEFTSMLPLAVEGYENAVDGMTSNLRSAIENKNPTDAMNAVGHLIQAAIENGVNDNAFDKLLAPLYTQEWGNAYADMVEEGVDHDVADTVSKGFGGLSAGIQLAMFLPVLKGGGVLAKIIPGAEKLIPGMLSGIKSAVLRGMVKVAGSYAGSVATMDAQMLSLEGLKIASEEIAKGVSNTFKGTNVEHATLQEIATRMVDNLWQSTKIAAALGLIHLPGKILEVARGELKPRGAAAQKHVKAAQELAEQPQVAKVANTTPTSPNFAPKLIEEAPTVLKTGGQPAENVSVPDIQRGRLPQGPGLTQQPQTAAHGSPAPAMAAANNIGRPVTIFPTVAPALGKGQPIGPGMVTPSHAGRPAVTAPISSPVHIAKSSPTPTPAEFFQRLSTEAHLGALEDAAQSLGQPGQVAAIQAAQRHGQPGSPERFRTEARVGALEDKKLGMEQGVADGDGRGYTELSTGELNFSIPDDPMRDITGPVKVSSPAEYNSILKQLEYMGVEVNISDGSAGARAGYGPSATGTPGKLSIDPDVSLSALQHELQHAIDDMKSGWRGRQVKFTDPDLSLQWERNAYSIEIKNAIDAGRQDVADYLKSLYQMEVYRTISFFTPDN